MSKGSGDDSRLRLEVCQNWGEEGSRAQTLGDERSKASFKDLALFKDLERRLQTLWDEGFKRAPKLCFGRGLQTPWDEALG